MDIDDFFLAVFSLSSLFLLIFSFFSFSFACRIEISRFTGVSFGEDRYRFLLVRFFLFSFLGGAKFSKKTGVLGLFGFLFFTFVFSFDF